MRTKHGRIFSRTTSGGIVRYYGCLYRIGRRVHLGDDICEGAQDLCDARVRVPALAGRYAAYGDETCDLDAYTCTTRLVVRSLKTGRTKRRISITGDLLYVVVTSAGSVGFLTEVIGPEWESTLEIWKADRGGRKRLDTGNIGRTSLRLRQSTMSWTKGGQRRTATLR